MKLQRTDYCLGYKHILIAKFLKKPKVCPGCKKYKKLELSNLDHKYSLKLSDWKWRCHSCHFKYDYKVGLRIAHHKKKGEIFLHLFTKVEKKSKITGNNFKTK